jgi:phosphatidylethanolamine-binding protein (PEBP) family uncharacterized protein
LPPPASSRAVAIPPTAAGSGFNHAPQGGHEAVGYKGPCPPKGDPPHRYRFTLTALKGTRELARGSITVRYQRA